MNFYKFLLISISFLLFAFKAEAGFVLNRPLYIGLGSGLVGYWSFDGQDIAGVTAYDRSGQNNTGTLTNGPVRAEGRIGQALDFDGGNDLVNAGSAATLDDLGPLTFTAWIYPRSAGESDGNMVAKGSGANAGIWQFVIDSTTQTRTLKFSKEAGTPNLIRQTSNNAVNFNQWQHVAVTWDGTTNASNVHIYINGTEQSYQTTTNGNILASDAARDLIIGNESDAGDTFDGLIDEVRVYNRVLSSDEIKRLYKIGATTKISVPSNTGTLRDGLVGYWSFDGQDIAGVTAYDRSGQNNTGTLTNGPVRAEGRIGQALEFDGSDDRVNLGDVLDYSSGLSISAWIYPRSLGEQSQGLIMDKQGGAASGYRFGLDTTNRLHFRSDGTTANTNNNAISLNTWQHAVVAYDGTTVQFYVNGQTQGTATITDTPNANTVTLQIGNQDDALRTFDGLIDEVRVYNRALSSDEIKRLYKIGATTKINVPSKTGTLQDGLVGYWSFDGPDVAGVTAYDRSGQNNTGTLTNGPVRAEGRIGQALNFDGVDDEVNSGSAASLNNLGPLTASAWIYPRTTGEGALSRIIDKTTGLGPVNGWIFNIDNTEVNGIGFAVDYVTTKLNRSSSANFITLNTWQHVVVTWDGSDIASNIHIYVNGTEVSYGSTQNGVGARNSDTTASLRIGNNSTGARTFDGLIDDVRVYNRALSTDEIKRLYNMGR